MLQDVDKTVEWLRLNNIVAFKVRRSEGDNNFVFKSLDDETLENAITRFRQVMNVSFGGRYIIDASTETNKQTVRGLFKEEFANLNPNMAAIGNNQSQNTPLVGYISKDEAEAMFEKRIQDYERDKKLQVLEEENKRLASELKEKDTVVNRIFERIEPHVGKVFPILMNRFFPQVAVAGTDDNTVFDEHTEIIDETTEEMQIKQNRLETALAKWAAADSEFIDVIEFISSFAANGTKISPFPGVNLDYAAIKEMLLKK